MSNGAAAAGGAGAAAAAIANAIKASGVLVRLEPEELAKLLARAENPLVVTAQGFLGGYRYLMAYRGLAFYAKSPEPLSLPSDAEVVTAKKIWIPS